MEDMARNSPRGAVSGGEDDAGGDERAAAHVGVVHVDGGLVRELAQRGAAAADDAVAVSFTSCWVSSCNTRREVRGGLGTCGHVAAEVRQKASAATLYKADAFASRNHSKAVAYGGQRIVGGSEASRGQFPHQAALTIDYSAFCGGSLLAARWVITAAHCAYGASTWRIYLGGLRTDLASEEGRITITSNDAMVHEQYDPYYITSDVAVINLGQDVEFTDYIRPIQLPPRSLSAERFVGETLTISGWGYTSDGSYSVSAQLMFVRVPVLSNAVCQLYYGESVLSSTLCTSGASARGTCGGDSGGPVMRTSEDGSFVLLGVVSYGSIYGCERDYPAGHARVTSFLDWISEKTGIVVS